MVLPDDEEPNRVDLSEAPPEAAESPPEPPPPAPVKRKRRSFFGSILSTLLLLALLAGAALYGAIAFKDRDERLKAVADYAAPYVDQGNVVFDALKNRLGALLGEKEAAPEKETVQEKEPSQATATPSETPAQPAEAAAEPTPAPQAAPATPTESAETTPAKPAETAAEPTLNAQRPETAANGAGEAQNAAIEAQKAAVAALQSRLESAEDLAQRALRAAEAAGAAASAAQAAAEAATKAHPTTEAAGAGPGAALSPSDQLAALEGRIDELGDEMKALRGRLESPKNESRAAPEAAPAKTPKTAVTAEGPAALVVVAYALQREFEAGRPYAVETKALTRLGADPAALAALSPFAEKGAPTAAQLKADFAPAAKRIRALENGDSGDLAQHLMKGASKLVRVRPSGAPSGEVQSVDEKVAHIDAALAHGDLAQANALFAALPENARNEAKDFGAALQARIEAGQAADNLLHGAIAALVATKE